jgi:hypothetical protein
MSFFQNVFDVEFRGTLFGADRQYQTTYKVPASQTRGDYLINYSSEPFDLTGKTNLTINYAFDPDLRNYFAITTDVTSEAADVSAVRVVEVVSALNNDPAFNSYFKCVKHNDFILITPKKARTTFRIYVSNSSAESVLRFNKKSVVVELPSYFEKYSIDNRFNYPDLGSNRLVLLDPNVSEDAVLITEAGFDPLNPTPDWKLLKGSNDAFWFFKRTYSNGKLATELKYPAGAAVGDLAKKTYYVYEESDLVQVMETPYVLQSADLMIPPS